MVKSPVIRSFPAPTCSTFFDLNVIVGYLATSKKWSLRKSLSRSGTRVSTEAASIVTSTEDFAMSLSSNCTVPLTFVKAPRTVEIVRWRTANCAAEWFGSICHVEFAACPGSASTAASVAVIPMRAAKWPIPFLLFSFSKERWLLGLTCKIVFAASLQNFAQQACQSSYPRRRHVMELVFMQFADRLFQPLQNLQTA